MRSAMCLAASAALMVGCSALAPDAPPIGGSPDRMSECGYERFSFDACTVIPDDDPAGLTIGPIHVPDDGSPLDGVVLRLDIAHVSPADLQLSIRYDSDDDGKPDAGAPLELHRARGNGWAAGEPHACPSRLDGTYYFEDDSPCGEGDVSLSAFDGMRPGGAFYLVVADTLADDTGVVRGWSVYMRRPEGRSAGRAYAACPASPPAL